LTKVSRPIVEENCSLVEDKSPFRHANYDLPKTYDINLDGDIYLSDLDFSENITMIGGGFLGTDSENSTDRFRRAVDVGLLEELVLKSYQNMNINSLSYIFIGAMTSEVVQNIQLMEEDILAKFISSIMKMSMTILEKL